MKEYAGTEIYRTVDLTCPLTHSRLIDPVTIPKLDDTNESTVYSRAACEARLPGGDLYDENLFKDLTKEDLVGHHGTNVLLNAYPDAQGDVFCWDWLNLDDNDVAPMGMDEDGDDLMTSAESAPVEFSLFLFVGDNSCLCLIAPVDSWR